MVFMVEALALTEPTLCNKANMEIIRADSVVLFQHIDTLELCGELTEHALKRCNRRFAI